MTDDVVNELPEETKQTKKRIRRNKKGYEYADDQGWIYHNKYGQTMRCLDPVDLNILVEAGYLMEDTENSYRCTDKQYKGLIFSDLLDTMRMYDASITYGYYVETED